MLAGAGGQHQMARPYSQDLRDRVIGSVAREGGGFVLS